MATSKKFSQLPAASSISNNDLAAIAHEDALAETGYESQKATMIQIGKKILGDIEYVTDLPGFPSDEQNPFAALLYLRDSILDLLPVDEVSGAVANFETEFALPLIDVKAEIKAVETGTGAKAPSNPYVISGFTGTTFKHRGVNLFDEQWELGNFDDNTGEPIEANNRIRGKNFCAIVGGISVYCYNGGLGNSRILWYDKDKNYISNTGWFGISVPVQQAPNNARYFKYNFAIQYGTTYNNDVSINYPSTDMNYHAYDTNCSDYPVSWQTEAGEIFGGEVDIISGKLKLTHEIFSLIGAEEEEYSILGDGTTSRRFKYNPILSQYSEITSSTHFQMTSSNSGVWGYMRFVTNLIILTDKESTIVDVAALKSFLATEHANGRTVQFIMKLATPIEIDLSDTESITALLGTNNLWNDTNGNTTVDYKLGIQAYIDKKIAEVQALVL